MCILQMAVCPCAPGGVKGWYQQTQTTLGISRSASCLVGDKDWGWKTSKLTYERIQLAEKRPVLCNHGKDRCSINGLYRVTPNTLGALPSITSPLPFLGVLSLPYKLSIFLTIYPGLILCCGTQEPGHFNRRLRDILAGTWDLDLCYSGA